MTRYALVCGAGGFIGGHLVKWLKREGSWVRGVDLTFHDSRRPKPTTLSLVTCGPRAPAAPLWDRRFDEVYQLAADMSGAGYLFTGEHDAEVPHNSAMVNLNMLDACHKRDITKVFHSSSALGLYVPRLQPG